MQPSDDAAHRPVGQRNGSDTGHALTSGLASGDAVPGSVHKLPSVDALTVALVTTR